MWEAGLEALPVPVESLRLRLRVAEPHSGSVAVRHFTHTQVGRLSVFIY